MHGHEVFWLLYFDFNFQFSLKDYLNIAFFFFFDLFGFEAAEINNHKKFVLIQHKLNHHYMAFPLKVLFHTKTTKWRLLHYLKRVN